MEEDNSEDDQEGEEESDSASDAEVNAGTSESADPKDNSQQPELATNSGTKKEDGDAQVIDVPDSFPENGEQSQVEAVEVKVESTKGTKQENQEETATKPLPKAAEDTSSLVSNKSVIIHSPLRATHCSNLSIPIVNYMACNPVQCIDGT